MKIKNVEISRLYNFTPILIYQIGNGENTKLKESKKYVDSLSGPTSLVTLIKIRNYYYDLDKKDQSIFAEYVFKKFFKKDNKNLDNTQNIIEQLPECSDEIISSYDNLDTPNKQKFKKSINSIYEKINLESTQ
jgi:hypothetical protein